jgi:hypothetical protein
VYLYRFKRYIFEYRCPPLGGGDEASPRKNTHMIPANSWMNSMAASTIKKPVLADAPTNFEILQEQNAEPGY